MARPAETDKVRRWNGANPNAPDEVRVWVVWGLAEDRQPDDGTPAPGLAVKMAELADPEFAAADGQHRWIMMVEGNEDDVDAWVQEHGEVSAYAAYLVEPLD